VVRQGRGGLELRVDGTLASLHHTEATLSGIVWWTLAAPVLLLARRRKRRVLLLGLGGGSVARAIRALDPDAHIVGVERDAHVLRLARRHFGMDGLGVEVVADDAFRYLRQERRRFDLVVEDLFVGSLRTVHKPKELLQTGYDLLRRRLRPEGIIVSNTIHETPAVARALRLAHQRLLSIGVQGYWNHILVCGRDVPDPREVRRLLHTHGAFERLLPRLSIRAL
jgi:spermidine synthase